MSARDIGAKVKLQESPSRAGGLPILIMDSNGIFNLNTFAKKLAYDINLLLPPCHLKPDQLDGGNSITRIVAISCVLLIHLRAYLNQYIQDLFPINSCCSCCFWAVPAFICLSGKLIPIQIPYKLFYKKTFNKIFLPTIFWSIVFSLFVFFKSEHSLKAIINNFMNSRPFFIFGSCSCFAVFICSRRFVQFL